MASLEVRKRDGVWHILTAGKDFTEKMIRMVRKPTKVKIISIIGIIVVELWR